MRFCSIITVAIGDRASRAAPLARHLSAVATLPLTELHVPDEAVGSRVAASVNGRDGALLVIDARGGGLGGDRLDDTEAEEILQRVRQPTLVLGPHAHEGPVQSLIVPVDGAQLEAMALPAIDRWVHTFDAPNVIVLVLEPPDTWPAMADDPGWPAEEGRHLVTTLRERGVRATVRRVEASVPWRTIASAVDAERSFAVLVVATPRWPGLTHWYATTRRLIRRATCPVLVVPSDATPCALTDG